MKRKIVPFLIVGILVLGGLGASAVTEFTDYGEVTVKMTEFSSLTFTPVLINDYNDEFLEVNLEETYSNFLSPGQPVLPKVVKHFELPFGVKNINVNVRPVNVEEINIEGEIRPGPAFLPKTGVTYNIPVEPQKDMKTYTSDEPYPSSWYRTQIGCGRNAANELVTHVSVQTYPVRYIPSQSKLLTVDSLDITITYDEPINNIAPLNTGVDMVIIAPSKFSNDLQILIDHKNNLDPPINTILKTTEEIYNEYNGVDKPEDIKLYIHDAMDPGGLNLGIKYVLLVGGLKSLVYGQERDDDNQGSKDWLVPVRYNNIYDNPKFPLEEGVVHDPGVISDLYYADIYKTGGVFEDWDPNGDGIIFGWGKEGYVNDTGYDSPYNLDLYPDIAVGRLACRAGWELRGMIDKIIKYEDGPADPSWFNNMMVASGDGFLDQTPLDIQWDTNDLDTGEYIIYAQSTNPDGISGPIDEIHVTVDHSQATDININHDDHLQFDTYPFPPISEITSPSNGDILGYNDTFERPGENIAYCNEFLDWANIEYTDGVMFIRGKSYDPQPYGTETDLHVWVNDSSGVKVFEQTVEGLAMYYEGEWTTGAEPVNGGPGALYYMDDFNANILWPTNGKFTKENGPEECNDAFSAGNGFAFFSGHGSPFSWGNHLSGIPGNRNNAHTNGYLTTTVFMGWGPPYFPMERASNKYKNPVAVVGGCHNSQFNVSFISCLLKHPALWTYGIPTPECWSWWLTRLSKRGSICCIGNTGLGYGIIGADCNTGGLDGGICIEFFKQYGQEGQVFLGDAYLQTQTTYVTQFDMALQEHGKSLSQWVLLGDPSLKIGGYENSEPDMTINIFGNGVNTDTIPGVVVDLSALNNKKSNPVSYEWSLDKDGDGVFTEDDSYQTGEFIEETWDSPGVYWVKLVTTYDDGSTDITWSVVDVETIELPTTPTKPSGKTSIQRNIPNIYSTSATDPYDYDLFYVFDWGDGNYDVVGPKASGKEVSALHAWNKEGSYDIRVLAVDTEVAHCSGEWSDPLTITVTKSKSIVSSPVVQFLYKIFENHPDLFPILRQILGL